MKRLRLKVASVVVAVLIVLGVSTATASVASADTGISVSDACYRQHGMGQIVKLISNNVMGWRCVVVKPF